MSGSRESAPEAGRVFTPAFLRVAATGFLVFASFQGLMAVLPLFMAAHGMTVTEVGWAAGLFTLTAVALRPLVGRELDRRGRRRLYLGGVLIITVAFVLLPWAIRILPLLLLRVLHGIGWAMASTAAGALVQDVVPPARRGEATGYYSNFTDVAMAVGPFVASALMTRAGFSAFVWVCAVALVLGWALLLPLREPRAPARRRPAQLLVAPARLPATVQLLLNLNFGAVMTFLPLLAVRRGLTRPVAGVATYTLFYMAYAVTLLLARGPLGRLSDRRGRGLAIVPGMVLLTAAAVGLAHLSHPAALVACAALFGLGFGASQPALLAWTIERTPEPFWGGATGTYYAAFDLGIGVASLALAPVAQASFTVAFEIAATASLAALVLYLAATGRHWLRPR